MQAFESGMPLQLAWDQAAAAAAASSQAGSHPAELAQIEAAWQQSARGLPTAPPLSAELIAQQRSLVHTTDGPSDAVWQHELELMLQAGMLWCFGPSLLFLHRAVHADD